MNYKDILSILKAGVAGQSGDKDGHDFRGNQWTVMGPWGQPVPRPRDPATNKPLKGAALAAELARLYPSPNTPIPNAPKTTAKPASPKVSGSTPKSPKAPKAPKATPAPAPTPTPVATTPTTPPKPVDEAPKAEAPKVEEVKPEEPKKVEDNRVITEEGQKSIQERIADAEKWEPKTDLEKRASESASKIAAAILVPKERRPLFVKNLTTVLTQPKAFRDAVAQAKTVEVNDRVRDNAAMLKMIGFTGLPKVVSEAEFKATPGKVAYSGLSYTRSSTQTLQQKLATLYNGEFPRYGGPMFGAAFYTSESKDVPVSYAQKNGASGTNTCIFRNKLVDPNNVYNASGNGPMIKLDVLSATAREDHGKYSAMDHPDYNLREIMSDAGYTDDEINRIDNKGSQQGMFTGDNNCKSIGPALAGYDALKDTHHNYTMVLNRGAMVLPDTYATNIQHQGSFGPEGAANVSDNVPVDSAYAISVPTPKAPEDDEQDVAKGESDGHPYRGNQYGPGKSDGTPEKPKPLPGSEEETEEVVKKLTEDMKLPPAVIRMGIQVARPLLAEAAKYEPAITKAISQSVKESGGTRKRAQSAVKSLSSATEKAVRDTADSVQKGLTAEITSNSLSKEAGEIHDLVRYTVIWPQKEIASGANKMIQSLANKGFVPYKDENGTEMVKNYFHDRPGNSYRGINANFVDPKSGMVFEVQFHTLQSLDTAEKMHKIYNSIRKLDKTDPAYEKGQEKMRAGFAQVKIPPGIDSVGNVWFKKAII